LTITQPGKECIETILVWERRGVGWMSCGANIRDDQEGIYAILLCALNAFSFDTLSRMY
jgi:hypothetical protein